MNENNVIQLEVDPDFQVINCCSCDLKFAVPVLSQKRFWDRGHTFYCPNGHSIHYADSPAIKKRDLVKELEEKCGTLSLEVQQLKKENRRLRNKIRPFWRRE